MPPRRKRGRPDDLPDAAEAEHASVEQDLTAAIAAKRSVTRAMLSMLPHFSRYSQCSSLALSEEDPRHEYLSSEFLRTVLSHRGPRRSDPHREKPQLEILRIERVITPRLQEKYLAEVQDVAGLCERRVEPLPDMDALRVESFDGVNVNEYLLFHGAPSNLIERLQMQGLDHRYAGSHFGKLFGSGTYLAANSSKSDIYTEPNDEGERCVLVVRACLGEAFKATDQMSNLTRPPERPDGRGPLNSVVALTTAEGGCVEYREAIVFERSAALPQFAIWYKHRWNCRCTHCVMIITVIRIQHNDLPQTKFEIDVFPMDSVSSIVVKLADRLGAGHLEFNSQRSSTSVVTQHLRLSDWGVSNGSVLKWFEDQKVWPPSGNGEVFVKTLTGKTISL